jgi:hypothetical protein
VGVNLGGEVVVRKKFSRKQLLHFTANLQVELIEFLGPRSCFRAVDANELAKLASFCSEMAFLTTNRFCNSERLSG